MKLLRQTIRSMLLTESIHPKINQLIDRFEAINAGEDESKHLRINLEIDGGEIVIQLRKVTQPGMPDDGSYEGVIEAVKYNERCLDAFEVTWASEKNLGLGPLLYDIVMEAASQEGTGLMCDRSEVSGDAFSVWNKYLHMRCQVDKNGNCKSPDIEIKQLDHEDWPETPELEDDCRGTSSMNRFIDASGINPREEDEISTYMEYWHNEDPLSKVYIKKSPSVIRRLKPYIDFEWDEPRWL